MTQGAELQKRGRAHSLGSRGHLVAPARTLIEERVWLNKVVWCGGGVKAAMLRCTPAQLLAGAGGERVALAQE